MPVVVADRLAAVADALAAWARVADDALVVHVEAVTPRTDEKAQLAFVAAHRPSTHEQSLVLLLAERPRAAETPAAASAASDHQWLLSVGLTAQTTFARAFREGAPLFGWRAGFACVAADVCDNSAWGRTAATATAHVVQTEEPAVLATEYAARRADLSASTVLVAAHLRELLAAIWRPSERTWTIAALEDES